MDHVDLAFEARAFGALHSGKIEEAVLEGISWFLDQLFSKRSAHFVSYVTTVLTSQFEKAIEICKFGLKSNPGLFALVNNLAFSYASVAKFDEAHDQLKILSTLAHDEREKIIYTATCGYTFFKQGIPQVGQAKYEEAILLAKEGNHFELRTLATAYLIREQYLAGELEPEMASKFLEDLSSREDDFDIRLQLTAIFNSVLMHIARGAEGA